MNNNYYNNGYGNYSYQQPTNPYANQNYQQPMQRPTQSLFVLVSNDAEAQAYIVQPNQTVYLLNLKEQKLTIKKADQNGFYEPIKYSLVDESQNQNTGLKTSNFATLEQVNNLQLQINQITQKLSQFTPVSNNAYNPQEESGD